MKCPVCKVVELEPFKIGSRYDLFICKKCGDYFWFTKEGDLVTEEKDGYPK